MTRKPGWTKQDYEASVTSRCWRYTPLDAPWKEIQGSSELREIFEEEAALDRVPEWAEEIADRMIGSPLPPCGHYTFPKPILQVLDAIGKEKCPEFFMGCYTADSQRKTLMSYYVYCLDAWLKRAPLTVASAELAMRHDLGKNWPQIIQAIYETIGERSQPKELLVQRLVHRLRWWIKTLIWTDDKRDRFMPDVYMGDVRGDEKNWGSYGNPPYGDPFFAERELPQMEELSRKICETVPGGKDILFSIEHTWLCAPKAFRYVEKIILKIGSIGRDGDPEAETSVLDCEDTYPDLKSCCEWYAGFMSSVESRLEGDSEALDELGTITPVKHWLVRILRQKLKLYEEDSFGRLVGTKPAGKSGTRII